MRGSLPLEAGRPRTRSPEGDYIQGLEDALAWSGREMSKGTDPAPLHRRWQDVVQGKDFILLFFGNGAPPVR